MRLLIVIYTAALFVRLAVLYKPPVCLDYLLTWNSQRLCRETNQTQAFTLRSCPKRSPYNNREGRGGEKEPVPTEYPHSDVYGYCSAGPNPCTSVFPWWGLSKRANICSSIRTTWWRPAVIDGLVQSLSELGRKRDKAERGTADLKEEQVWVIYKQPLVTNVLILRPSRPPSTSAVGKTTGGKQFPISTRVKIFFCFCFLKLKIDTLINTQQQST